MRHKRDPVRHTCPDVDGALNDVSSATRELEDAVSTLGGIGRRLEELRKSNEALREWATEEAERVDELEREMDDLRCDHDNEMRDMRDRAERAEARVAELEATEA